MKRAAFVLTGTAIGVGAVTSIHTVASSGAASGAAQDVVSHATTTHTGSSSTTSSTSSSSTTTASRTAAHSALGESVAFQYGQLQVKVTERAGKITNVAVESFRVNDPRSEQIDDQAVPELRSEVLSAQSAKIDGVSGASYTSQAYERSVQSALDRLR